MHEYIVFVFFLVKGSFVFLSLRSRGQYSGVYLWPLLSQFHLLSSMVAILSQQVCNIVTAMKTGV